MRKLAIVMAIALLPASAHAQVGLGNSASKYVGPPTARSDAERKTDDAIDRAYEDQLKNPQFSKKNETKTKNSDPWGALRPESSAKP
jgi:hypothetical protein